MCTTKSEQQAKLSGGKGPNYQGEAHGLLTATAQQAESKNVLFAAA